MPGLLATKGERMSAPESAGVGTGSLLDFEYPERNRIGLRVSWKRRRILVERIIDTLHQPIDPRAIELQPLRRRGRWLIFGHDLDCGKARAFYWEVMRHVCRPVSLQLGIYDPLAERPQIVGCCGVFAPTRKAREQLGRVAREYRLLARNRDDIWLNVGVFPWEGRDHDPRLRSG